MPDFINASILKDSSIDQSKKFKGTVYLKKECYEKIDSLIKLSGSNPSRNDVLESAVDFYFGYITSQLSQDYLCGVFGSKVEGLVNTLGTRMSRSNFRSAVETDMITRMLAMVLHINKLEYDKLRNKSVQDVKRTNGSIDIMDAISESEEES